MSGRQSLLTIPTSQLLRNLSTILRLEKFRPLSAENGRVGVDLAKKQKPDLILCDVMMPGLDGYGVIAALRADAETVTIPFIFLTAKAERLDIRAGMNLVHRLISGRHTVGFKRVWMRGASEERIRCDP